MEGTLKEIPGVFRRTWSIVEVALHRYDSVNPCPRIVQAYGVSEHLPTSKKTMIPTLSSLTQEVHLLGISMDNKWKRDDPSGKRNWS
jgi:hypothetical protein